MPTAGDFSNTIEGAPRGVRLNSVSALITLGCVGLGTLLFLSLGSVAALVGAATLGVLGGTAPQIAKQWERAVVLRLGRYRGLRGPGLLVEELNDPNVQDQGATISRNGRELIFWSGGQSRTRPGSVGLADLWVSTRRSIRDPWSAPENLGAPVNSPFADLEPVLSTDGRTLFFSSGSARRPGLGMTDIWMTTRAPNASEPGEQTEGDDGGEGGDKVGSRAHRRCPDMR